MTPLKRSIATGTVGLLILVGTKSANAQTYLTCRSAENAATRHLSILDKSVLEYNKSNDSYEPLIGLYGGPECGFEKVKITCTRMFSDDGRKLMISTGINRETGEMTTMAEKFDGSKTIYASWTCELGASATGKAKPKF